MFRNTPAKKRTVLSLKDNDLLRVAITGLEIERALDGPQDIEWCIEEDRLAILQARPITALGGHPLPKAVSQ